MNFAELNAVKIPEGNVASISANGNVIWAATKKITWDDVFASVDAGTYATDFAIGDTAPLDLGSEGLINMQIVAFDTDDLADGSGKAPITWIAKNLLNSKNRINPSMENVYEQQEVDATNNLFENKTYESNTLCYIHFEQPLEGEIAETTTTITSIDVSRIEMSYNCWSSGGNIDIIVNGETVVTGYDSYDTEHLTIPVEVGSTITVVTKCSRLGNGYDANISFYSNYGSFVLTNTCNKVLSNVIVGAREGTGSIGGWEKCEMRSYLKETIKPLIPESVRNAIKEVTKTHNAYDTALAEFTQTTIDDVWIPSASEVLDSGCLYSAIYPDKKSRKKLLNGAANHWFLRDSYDASKTQGVETTGSLYNFYANVQLGIALSFCT